MLRLRSLSRLVPQVLQVLGLGAALLGLVQLAGAAWTLLLAGIAAAAVGALYEARTPPGR